MVVCGSTKIDQRIARDAMDHVEIRRRRTLVAALPKLRDAGMRLVGLEQTEHSQCLFDYQFERRTALVLGHERLGLSDEELEWMDDLVEIPVFGLPFSYNVMTATTMAVYEYCRQFPRG